MAYEHLFSNDPIQRSLEFNGKQEAVYFKRLTAGEQMSLKKGQRGNIRAGESSFEVDLGDVDERNHRFLYYTNCDANGKRVFKSPAEVSALPGALFSKLFELANDALSEEDAGK